jgi:ParB/RepB/Spo0J family partition protein
VTTRELLSLPLDRITCASQVRERFDDAQLSGLAQSLSETGLLQPILVRPCADGWIVVDGERRLRSARAAGWTTIPAIVESAELSEAQCMQQQLVANCQRENLTPIETSRALDQLMKAARWSRTQVAARLGLSPASVSRLLALLALPADVQQRIHRGELAASTGYEIAKTADADRRAELVATATRGELKRDAAAKQSRAARKSVRQRRDRCRRSARITIPIGDGHAVSVAVKNLTVGRLIERLEQLTERLRALNPRTNEELAAALDALAEETHQTKRVVSKHTQARSNGHASEAAEA